ncbi:MAG: hypothetical protein Q4F18_04435 [Clostridia bacterium]|nr:hypothetical protein [Clostridia bacterium]
MTRVLRFPRLSAAACLSAIVCALMRDMCVSRGIAGWAQVFLFATLALLGLCFALMSCRFFVDAQGVGVGFLLRVRRTDWDDLASLGVLCCNSRRVYLYGMYRGRADFLQLLHRAPRCGAWGFVVPGSRKLLRAIATLCPYEVDLSPVRPMKRQGRLRPLWHQTVLYTLLLVPVAALAFLTGGLMLIRASGLNAAAAMLGLTMGAMMLFAAGCLLLHRAQVTAMTCPGISDKGVCAGHGLYLPWEDVRFGYVHRIKHVSGMFLLSQTLEEAGRRGAPPILCLSMPDTSTLLLAYLTYCPHARKTELE